MSESNKNLVQQFLKAVSGKEKPESLLRQFVSDETLIQHTQGMEMAFPRYEINPEDVIAEADKVVVRGAVRATHKGDLMGIPPTGIEVTVPLIIIYRIADGKVAQHWMNADMLGLMQQLGVVPAPGQ
jgi:predicted ester cyclase